MTPKQRDDAIKDLIGVIGSVNETGGMVKNSAAKSISHLLGEKVADKLGAEIKDLKSNPVTQTVIYQDGGLRAQAIKAMSEVHRVTDPPTTSFEVWELFEEYMNYCTMFLIPPTLGMWAIWLGIADEKGYNDEIEAKNGVDADLEKALRMTKEVLRGFLETNAMDGNIAPNVYLHQSKAHFGAVESVEQVFTPKTDKHVSNATEIEAIINSVD